MSQKQKTVRLECLIGDDTSDDKKLSTKRESGKQGFDPWRGNAFLKAKTNVAPERIEPERCGLEHTKANERCYKVSQVIGLISKSYSAVV